MNLYEDNRWLQRYQKTETEQEQLRFGLTATCIADIQRVLSSSPQLEKAVLFGSRAMGTYKNSSDIDLVLLGDALTHADVITLYGQLDELPYAYTYDLIDYNKISNPAVKAHIDDLGIAFYEKEQSLLPTGWKECTLGEVIRLKRGYDLPQQNRIEGNVPIFSSAGLSGYHSESKVNGPGVITGRYGTLGEIYYCEERFWPHNTTLYVQDFKGNDPKYIYYLLKTLGFSHHNDKSGVPGVNRNDLHSLIVKIPPLEIQQEIASILSAFDDKIELNRRMNQTLETIAQTLFTDWFVHFNFPGFDGELVDGLPKGWRMGTVLDFTKLLSGGTPKTDVNDYWNGEIGWISAKDVTANDKSFVLQTEKTITQKGLMNSSAKLLPVGTTVISARGTVGNICFLSEPMAISQSNYGLKSQVIDTDFFTYIFIENLVEQMQKYSYGTVFDTITTKTFSQIEVAVPDYAIMRQYDQTLAPVFFKWLSNLQENQTLTKLRDSLLPKLMSGQISVGVSPGGA